MEASVVNFLSPGDKVLAITIGIFGQRFANIARNFRADVDELSFEMGTAADPQMVAERIKKDINKEIKAVLITHNETSTGVFNDIKLIKEAIGDHPALIIVDSQQFGALELEMDEWGLDVVVSGSHKGFYDSIQDWVSLLLMIGLLKPTKKQNAQILLGYFLRIKILRKGANSLYTSCIFILWIAGIFADDA